MKNPFSRTKSPEVIELTPEERARSKQEAIDSYLAGKRAKEEAIEKAKYAHLDGLPEAERKRRIAYSETMDRLAKEAQKDRPRPTPSGDNIYLRYLAQDERDRKARNTFIAGTLAAGLVFWGGSVSLAASGFDGNDGRQFLEEMGYTDVEQTGASYILPGLQGCGTLDVIAYHYETTAANGAVDVEMTVCTGVFKAATARKG